MDKKKMLDIFERIATALENIEHTLTTKTQDCEEVKVVNAINQVLSSAIHDTVEESQS